MNRDRVCLPRARSREGVSVRIAPGASARREDRRVVTARWICSIHAFFAATFFLAGDFFLALFLSGFSSFPFLGAEVFLVTDRLSTPLRCATLRCAALRCAVFLGGPSAARARRQS